MRSLDAYQRALVNFRAILEPNSFRVAQINLKLGEHYGRQEGYAQAAARSLKVIDYRAKKFGPDDQDKSIKYMPTHLYETERIRYADKRPGWA